MEWWWSRGKDTSKGARLEEPPWLDLLGYAYAVAFAQPRPTIDALDGVLRALPASELVKLDEYARRGWNLSREPVIRWPEAMAFCQALPKSDNAPLRLFAMGAHCSGQMRQAALSCLLEHPHHFTWAIALIRCGDWVEPVRQEAKRVLTALADRAGGKALFPLLPLVARIRTWSRVDVPWLDQFVGDVMADPVLCEQLRRAIASPVLELRRISFEWLLTIDPDTWASLAERALTDSDARIAHWGLSLLSRHPPSSCVELFRRGMRSSLSSVRAECLRRLANDEDQLAHARVVSALNDPAMSVRNVAAYLLRQRWQQEPLVIWREHADQATEPSRGILQSLADYGDASDLPRLRRWLSSTRGISRAACWQGILRIGQHAIEDFEEASADCSSKVWQAVIRSIGSMALPWTVDKTLAWLHGSQNELQFARRLSQCNRLSKWDALQVIVSSAQSLPPFHEAIRHSLICWKSDSNSRFASLSDTQRNVLQNQIAELSDREDRLVWEDLRRYLN